jgi:hypothetical protein
MLGNIPHERLTETDMPKKMKNVYLNKNKNNTEKILKRKIQKNKRNEDIKIENYDYKIYSLFTYQMGSKMRGCINRDLNATKCFKLIFESLIRTGRRPKIMNKTEFFKKLIRKKSQK